MKKAILSMMLLAGGTLFAAPRVSIGFSFGNPAPMYAARPVCPGPGYVWVDGYRGAQGYWKAPVRVAPRFVEQRRDFGRNDNHGFDRHDNDRHDNNRRDNDRNNDRDFGRGFRR